MHGRVKSVERAKEENKTENDRIEEFNKVKMYKEIVLKILKLKREGVYDSEVVLPLTRHLLLLNQEFHIIWGYRREILAKMKESKSENEMLDMGKEELQLTFDALSRNPKSYAAWFHRQWLVEQALVANVHKEIILCNKLLEMDERNFHCWSYRRFISNQIGMTREQEFQFSTAKIEQNFSNYSALHHRSISLPSPMTSDIVTQEITLVQQAVFTEPDDQSAWFYYRWLIGIVENASAEDSEFHSFDIDTFYESQIEWVNELYEMEGSSKWVLVTLADLYARVASNVPGKIDLDKSKAKSIELFEKLKDEIDVDHQQYYLDRIAVLS